MISLENILKKIFKIFFIYGFFLIIFSNNCISKERWIIDKDISSINFEVPVLFSKNVKGQFNEIYGFVEIDLINKVNNKAIISAEINSIDINYTKYRELILGQIFFDAKKYPIAIIDTKKFEYKDEKNIKLEIELTIKGKSKYIPISLMVNKLTNDLVQVSGDLEFSRNEFNIGINKWRNTTILKDGVMINANIFLFKE